MFRKDTIVALDIGAGSVKLGVFRAMKGTSLELLRYATRELDADPAKEEGRLQEISLALQDISAELGLGASSVLVSVPGQSVFSRFVKLPPVGRDKVLQIVQYEAQQNVPFPINEVVWDYQLIGSREGEIDVMLAAIKAEMIEQITGAVEKAGLHPELVDVAPMAVYNAVRYSYGQQLPGCTLVIDIGARSTDLIFIEENRVFNRSIPVGGNTITQQIMREFNLSYEDAEKLKKAHAFVAFGGAFEAPASQVADKVSKTVRTIMTRLHTEITRSINFYRTQQSGGEPTLALLTGGTSIIAYTDTFLKEKLKIDVDYLNPFISVSVNAAIDAGEIGGRAHLMSEVVGLALRKVLTCPIEINLLPQRFIKAETFKRKRPMLIASMAAFVLLCGLWAFFFYKLTTIGQARLDQIEGQKQQLESVENRLKEKETRIAEIQDKAGRLAALPEQRTYWPQVYDDIRARLLDGMWLTDVRTLRTGEAGTETGTASPAAGAPPAPPMPGSPEAATAAAPKPIEAIEVSGYAYKDKLPESGIIRFRDNLRQSPFFDPAKTDVVAQPLEGRDDFVKEFTIRIVLKTPVNL